MQRPQRSGRTPSYLDDYVSHIDFRTFRRQSILKTQPHKNDSLQFLKRRIVEGIKMKMNKRRPLTKRPVFMIHSEYKHLKILTRHLRTHYVDRKPSNIEKTDVKIIHTSKTVSKTFGVSVIKIFIKKSNTKYILKTPILLKYNRLKELIIVEYDYDVYDEHDRPIICQRSIVSHEDMLFVRDNSEKILHRSLVNLESHRRISS